MYENSLIPWEDTLPREDNRSFSYDDSYIIALCAIWAIYCGFRLLHAWLSLFEPTAPIDENGNNNNAQQAPGTPGSSRNKNQSTQTTDDAEQNNPDENPRQERPGRDEYWAERSRQDHQTIHYLVGQYNSTREELLNERLRNTGLGQDVPPTPLENTPEYHVRKHYESWKLSDISKDFEALTNSINTLAHELHWHSRNTASIKQNNIHNLAKSCKLIAGVPEQLWLVESIRLLQGAIWSILLETIFSNDFEVFGERATHFAEEIRDPKIEPKLASWRSLTAEKLLVRSGLLQYSSQMRNTPSENLRVLLVKEQSAGEPLLDTLRHVAPGLDVEDAPGIFADVDELVLQSIYDARMKFVTSLEILTQFFGARKRLAGMVARVVTNAQVVAIMMLCQPNIYQLVTPTIGDDLQQETSRQEENAIEAITSPDHDLGGNIVFTVNPGMRCFDNGDEQQPRLLRSALVYVTGIPIKLDVPTPHEPTPREDSEDYLERKIISAFLKLKHEIDEFAKSLPYNSELNNFDVPAIVQVSKPNTTDIPLHWNQDTRNVYKTQTCIWNLLSQHLFDKKFGCWSIAGEIFSTEWIKRFPRADPSNPTSLSPEANIWRFKLGRKLFEILGGPAFFQDPRAAVFTDELVESCFEVVKDTISVHICGIVEVLCGKVVDTTTLDGVENIDAIEQIVLRAMLLALLLDITYNHYEIWSPPYNTDYVRPPTLESRIYDLTNDCADAGKGRITFVVYPGLRFYSATDMKIAETVFPPLTYVTAEGTGNADPPPPKGPDPSPTIPGSNYRRPYVESPSPSPPNLPFLHKGRIQKDRTHKGRIHKEKIQKGKIRKGKIRKGKIRKGRIQKGRIHQKDRIQKMNFYKYLPQY